MIFKNFYKGDEVSKFFINGFTKMINVDPWSILGTIQPQYALETKSSSINEPTISVVLGSDTFYFSTTTGNVWQNDALVHTATNPTTEAHYYKSSDTKELIYFSSTTHLSAYDPSNALGLGVVWNDQLYALNNASHKMTLFDGDLFICNGAKIARVDSVNVFTDNTLDLPANYIAQDVYFYSTGLMNDLVIIANSTNSYAAKLFRWDTTEDSWYSEDEIFESELICFIPVDNSLLVLAVTGAIYQYTGRTLNQFTVIDPITQATSVTIGKQRSYLSHGTQIRSFHKPAKDFALGTVIEYTASDNISDINVSNNELIICTDSGLEQVSTTRATASLNTPVNIGRIKEVRVGYLATATPTSITVDYSLDNGSFVTTQSADRSADYKVIQTIDSPQVKRQVQAKVTFTGETIIDSIEFVEEG